MHFQLEVLPIPFNLTLIGPPFLYYFKCLNSFRENLLNILARPRSLLPINVLGSKRLHPSYPLFVHSSIRFIFTIPFHLPHLIVVINIINIINKHWWEACQIISTKCTIHWNFILLVWKCLWLLRNPPPASEYNVPAGRKISWVVWKFKNCCVPFLQYLNKNGITDISIENFSFSTKLHIGEFLECKEVCVVNGQFCYYEVARQAWQCNSM